jgi:thiamine biosynthesis lipoprotein
MPHEHSRRAWITGEALREEIAARQDHVAEAASSLFPDSPGAVALSAVAMACDIEAFAPSGPDAPVGALSRALDAVAAVEARISVYRDDTELVRVNHAAQADWVTADPDVFAWLEQAHRFAVELDGAFDPTTGPLVALWRTCRRELRLPTEAELAAARELVGIHKVQWDLERRAIRFDRPGMSLNLNALGKGAALDEAATGLLTENVPAFCLHAGHSSVLARGSAEGDQGPPGWTIAVNNPLMAHHRLARLRLVDAAMSTSGNGVQHFTVGGRRYGHLLDPRTGWPVDGFLSVSVVAPTAAEAEALSTAFFVLGVEKARRYCHTRWSSGAAALGAIFVPSPVGSRLLRPVVLGLTPDRLEFDPDEVAAVDWLDPQASE